MRYSDSLVLIEDLAELMQRAIAVIRQALSFASQHTAQKGMDGEGARYVERGRIHT